MIVPIKGHLKVQTFVFADLSESVCRNLGMVYAYVRLDRRFCILCTVVAGTMHYDYYCDKRALAETHIDLYIKRV